MAAYMIDQHVDLFTQGSTDLGMPLDAFVAVRSREGGQMPLAGDMEGIAQLDSNVEYVMKRQGVNIAEDPLRQTSTFPYAAACSSTSTSVGWMPAGDGIARDHRKREQQERQVRFRSVSPLPEEKRFSTGTQEDRNAREHRLRPFANEEANGDSDASGQLVIDRMYSAPESRRVGMCPGVEHATSSTAPGRHAAVQQQPL